MPHKYRRDQGSGAGNCECGAARDHVRHPHDFRRAMGAEHCVCTRPAADEIHFMEVE